MPTQSTIHFHGGAGSVTGSNFLLDTGSEKILIDCGLNQGTKEAEAINVAPFAYDPAEIDYLVVTHAHLDHIGRIPKLVKAGFKGVIYSTEATRVLSDPLLHDELSLMMHAHNRPGENIPPPLYEEKDVTAALHLWKGIGYHEPIKLGSVTLELLNSGHILGSAIAIFTRGEGDSKKSIAFTGDLGGGNSPLLPHCEPPVGVMESVYGNRTRSDSDRRERLENVIEEAAKRGGTLLIPAFSTERTQDLIYEIRTLMLAGKVPSMPVYLDSPLAEKITDAFTAHPEYFAQSIQDEIASGAQLFKFPQLHFIHNVNESHGLTTSDNPKIILAGSGMAQGGRVLAHEEFMLPDPKTTLLMVGYQAAGTFGRRLAEGASEIEIYGRKVAVRAHIEQIYGYSAHMDGEQLVEFVNSMREKVKKVFVVMGEPAASSTLVQRLRDFLGVNAVAPEAGESATIEL
jgi:metallo-beta-lactamase family protein